MKYLITLCSHKDSVILDPFMGSGSTLLAAKEAGRKCIGIDNDIHSCEIAVKRLKEQCALTFFDYVPARNKVKRQSFKPPVVAEPVKGFFR